MVTSKTVTLEHVKAARALLNWTASDLAEKSGVGAATVRRFESRRDINTNSRQAIYDALVKAGISFQNGGKPGVRLER